MEPTDLNMLGGIIFAAIVGLVTISLTWEWFYEHRYYWSPVIRAYSEDEDKLEEGLHLTISDCGQWTELIYSVPELNCYAYMKCKTKKSKKVMTASSKLEEWAGQLNVVRAKITAIENVKNRRSDSNVVGNTRAGNHGSLGGQARNEGTSSKERGRDKDS